MVDLNSGQGRTQDFKLGAARDKQEKKFKYASI